MISAHLKVYHGGRLDSLAPSTLSNPTSNVKVKVEASNGDESNCDGHEDANGGGYDKNLDPNDHSNYPQCGMWHGKDCHLLHKDAHNLEQDGYAIVYKMRFAMIRYLAMTIFECLLLKLPMEMEIKL